MGTTRRFLASGLVFVIVSAAGCGRSGPELTAGTVATVSGAGSTITKAELRLSIQQAAATKGLADVPKPGNDAYTDLEKEGLERLLEEVWIFAEGRSAGVRVSNRELAIPLAKLRRLAAGNPGGSKRFLEELHLVPVELTARLRSQLLRNKLRERYLAELPAPQAEEMERIYATQRMERFTRPAIANIRIILNENQQKAETAKKLLAVDNSAANWKTVATRFSEDPATNKQGGQWRGLPEGEAVGPLDAEIFSVPLGEVEGPLHAEVGYIVFEVFNRIPPRTQSFDDAKARIEADLKKQAEERFLTEFHSKWAARTSCAPEYTSDYCSS